MIVWLLVWLCAGAPSVQAWNAWLVSLLVLLVLELLSWGSQQ